MATAKPKVKRMMFGGAAAGVASKVLNPVKNAAKAAAAPQRAVPAYAKPYVAKQTPNYARPYTSAQKPPSSGQMPSQLSSLNRTYQDFKAQRSGNMGTGSQSAPNSAAIASVQRMKQTMGDPGLAMAKAQKAGMMKKGGAVKKKATKK